MRGSAEFARQARTVKIRNDSHCQTDNASVEIKQSTLWQRRYEELKRFKTRFDHCKVPINDENKALGHGFWTQQNIINFVSITSHPQWQQHKAGWIGVIWIRMEKTQKGKSRMDTKLLHSLCHTHSEINMGKYDAQIELDDMYNALGLCDHHIRKDQDEALRLYWEALQILQGLICLKNAWKKSQIVSNQVRRCIGMSKIYQ